MHLAPTSSGIRGLNARTDAARLDVAADMWPACADRGFVLAEYIIAVVLLLMVATAAIDGLIFAASSNATSATRAQAIEVGNQCIEQARNLPYDSVGTISGFPAGIIPDTNVVGGLTVNTVVEWAFDPVKHAETCKTITVTVSWTAGGTGSVSLQSSIFGKTAIKNTGDVTIAVVDEDTTKPIQGATVQITAVTGTTATKNTDALGTVTWGQVPSGNLVISGSAAGYILRLSQVTPAAVIANQMNSWTINAAKSSVGVVTVRDQSGNAIAGATVTIVGPSGTFSCATAGDGTATFTGLLKGTYSVTTSLAGYAGGSGTLGVIVGGSTYTCAVTLTKVTTLKVIAKDDAGAVVSGVALAVTPAGAAGPAQTDATGMALFTVAGTGPYTVSASMSGYLAGSATSGALVTGAENVLTVKITRIVPCTLTVTVVDQASVAVSGATVSVSGSGTATGPTATDSSGKAVYTLSLPGVYTVRASKTNYTTGSASTGSLTNGATAALSVTMPQITTGILAVTYTSSASTRNPKDVYIYDAGHLLVTTLRFTAKNQTINATLTAGQYYASSKTPWSSTAKAATVIVNTTVAVSVSTSN